MRSKPTPVASGFPALLEHLEGGMDLTHGMAVRAAHGLASEDVDPGLKERFLVLLAEKGETGVEIAAFAQTFRGLAHDPGVEEWADRAIDVCGTGGDRMGTFNISTAVMFVLAAGGVPVFKHGNRSITSQCGSADLLAALGIPMEVEQSVLHESLRELNFAFFFAPRFHPAFRTIMPVRKRLAERGQRSIFNILGPLINPGRPACQLLGVYSPRWLGVMAAALDSLGLRNGFIVHCRLGEESGLDELSCVGENLLVGFGSGREKRESWRSELHGLPQADLRDLAGGDVTENLAIFHRVIEGKAPAGLMNSILLNAGVAFETLGEAETVAEGIGRARDLLLSGDVRRLVLKAGEFYRS